MGNFNHTPMKQEVIQDFLNVPGIVGVALIDGMAPPSFHGFSDLAVEQNTIAQSIQQVLETTPDGFNAFEFEFDFYRAYLHKLNQGSTLLVLTNTQLSRFVYLQTVRRLLLELDGNQATAPAHSPITQTEATLTSSSPDKPVKPSPTSPPQLFSPQPPSPKPLSSTAPAEPASGNPQIPLSHLVNLKDILAAINALSRLAVHYLGTMVVANYWKTARPTNEQADWLTHFQIERSAEITFSVTSPSERLPVLTPEQHQCLQIWVAAFLERCSKVIRGFTKIVQQTLDKQQHQLLFD